MEKTIDQRLTELEDRGYAHGLLLKAYANLLLPDGDTRAYLRDKVCEVVERLYEDASIQVSHLRVQHAVAEIEEILGIGMPRSN